MASGLADLATVSATSATRTLSAAGFGRMCALAYHTRFPEHFRIYRELDAMVSDGFAVDEAAYSMVASCFAQNPRPTDVMVGRLPSAHTHTQVVTITSNTEGAHIKLTVKCAKQVATAIDYTIPAAQTLTQVAAAVELLIEAAAGVASAASVADITVTPVTAGDCIYITGLENCTVEDSTPDAGYDDQLAVIALASEGAGGFFFVATDTNSETNNDLVSTWAGANKKLFMYAVTDYTEKAGTGAHFSGMQSASSDFSYGTWTSDPEAYVNCGQAGFAGARSPGTFTLSGKTIEGVEASVLTSSEETNLQGVLANFYVTRAGVPMIRGGKRGGVCASGTHLDIVHGREAFLSDVQVAVAQVIASNEKVDYTDEGVDLLIGAVRGVQARYEGPGRLFKEGSTYARGESADAQSTTDKGNRYYGAIKFGGVYAGAIQGAGLVGTLTL
jgi:hypothetical protein